VVSTRMFARTGSVVFVGMLAETAFSPSWSFSREIVKRIREFLACGNVDGPLGF
jgi:hypothetical protein